MNTLAKAVSLAAITLIPLALPSTLAAAAPACGSDLFNWHDPSGVTLFANYSATPDEKLVIYKNTGRVTYRFHEDYGQLAKEQGPYKFNGSTATLSFNSQTGSSYSFTALECGLGGQVKTISVPEGYGATNVFYRGGIHL